MPETLSFIVSLAINTLYPWSNGGICATICLVSKQLLHALEHWILWGICDILWAAWYLLVHRNSPYGWSFEGTSSRAGKACWYLSTVGLIFSAIWNQKDMNTERMLLLYGVWEHTCWLISRMAISLRSVNSWNAASMVATWVSISPLHISSNYSRRNTYWSPPPGSSSSGARHGRYPQVTSQLPNPEYQKGVKTEISLLIQIASYLISYHCQEISILEWYSRHYWRGAGYCSRAGSSAGALYREFGNLKSTWRSSTPLTSTVTPSFPFCISKIRHRLLRPVPILLFTNRNSDSLHGLLLASKKTKTRSKWISMISSIDLRLYQRILCITRSTLLQTCQTKSPQRRLLLWYKIMSILCCRIFSGTVIRFNSK